MLYRPMDNVLKSGSYTPINFSLCGPLNGPSVRSIMHVMVVLTVLVLSALSIDGAAHYLYQTCLH